MNNDPHNYEPWKNESAQKLLTLLQARLKDISRRYHQHLESKREIVCRRINDNEKKITKLNHQLKSDRVLVENISADIVDAERLFNVSLLDPARLLDTYEKAIEFTRILA